MPERVTREGRLSRVEPLDSDRHGPDLWSGGLADGSTWAYLDYGPFSSEGKFLEWLQTRDQLQDPMYFAVVDRATGAALGLATLMEIRPAMGAIEIGHIVFSPALQRTPVATEAIFLLMRYVFDELGNRRFEWKCDNANEASKRAALRFGFAPEGVFRQHMMVKGRNRDTAWFSILDNEWPALKQVYESWLSTDNFEADGRQKLSLRALTSALRGHSS
jgi:RimJ/RimL family protein N-acetyltransferase